MLIAAKGLAMNHECLQKKEAKNGLFFFVSPTATDVGHAAGR